VTNPRCDSTWDVRAAVSPRPSETRGRATGFGTVSPQHVLHAGKFLWTRTRRVIRCLQLLRPIVQLLLLRMKRLRRERLSMSGRRHPIVPTLGARGGSRHQLRRGHRRLLRMHGLLLLWDTVSSLLRMHGLLMLWHPVLSLLRSAHNLV